MALLDTNALSTVMACSVMACSVIRNTPLLSGEAFGLGVGDWGCEKCGSSCDVFACIVDVYLFSYIQRGCSQGQPVLYTINYY